MQGLISLLDANASTGGLCVIPGSHREHDALCKRSPFSKGGGDFVPVGQNDPVCSLFCWLW